jgi:hypothetical protein
MESEKILIIIVMIVLALFVFIPGKYVDRYIGWMNHEN